MSAVYAFFVAVFVYKDMTLSKVPKVLLDSANMSAMLLYIITNAVMFSYLMTSEKIPQELAAWMLDKGLGVIAFLLFVNVVLLLAGNVMEPSSIVLIMAPILFPVAMKLGIDPVHFGIMMMVNMEVGMCHPPVGLNLYVASRHHQDGHHRAHGRRLAVAADDAGLPRHRHLLAGAVDLAAEGARHDVARGRSALLRRALRRRRPRRPFPSRQLARDAVRAAAGVARAAPTTAGPRQCRRVIILNLFGIYRVGVASMAVERTLSIIKPDAVAKNVIGKIYSRFETNGLKIVAAQMRWLSRAEAEGFYAVHRERPFFNDLVDFMTSGPVMIQVLEGENAIAKNRDLMGATDPKKAAPGTIRADFAQSIDANAVHGSDGAGDGAASRSRTSSRRSRSTAADDRRTSADVART